MKSTAFILVSLAFCSNQLNAQQTYDFLLDPVTTGWTYYSDTQSGGFSYLAGQGAIDYSITTDTGSQFYHRDLEDTLKKDYCVSFKIAPNQDNYNTFFPLLLTETEQAGPNYHPWRENPVGQSAGPMQNLDLIGIEVYGMEIRFVHRNDNLSPASIIQSLSPAFNMTNGSAYWVRLQVSNGTNADVRVFTDPAQTQEAASGQYTIPVLENLTHIYISNGNGNSMTTQYGYLDDYIINNCFLETAENTQQTEVTLFPNPTSGEATVQFSVALEDEATTYIIDQSGRVIYDAKISSGTLSYNYPVSDFINGTYMVVISSKHLLLRKELIIIR